MPNSQNNTIISESTRLVPSPKKLNLKPLVLTSLEYVLCGTVAVPTAVLNGISAAFGDKVNINNLNSFQDFLNLIDNASLGDIIFGLTTFLASQLVFTSLNKKYLISSTKAACDLIYRNLTTIVSLLKQKSCDNTSKLILAEDVLFMLSFLTSLIFAEIGSQSLSFLGETGKIIGFSLSLYVYFSTRYAGANFFFKNIFDGNWKLKNKYLNKFNYVSSDEFLKIINISESNHINQGINVFVNETDELYKFLIDFDSFLAKNKKSIRYCSFKYLAPFFGYFLAATTVLPVLLPLIPEAVMGFNSITTLNIGENDDFQNPGSFILGGFSAMLTLFFYELGIKELPNQLIIFIFSCFDFLKNNHCGSFLLISLLTFLSASSSFLSSLGFRLIAESLVDSGYLSYLGKAGEEVIPDFLFFSVFFMLWSHLQDLTNQYMDEKYSFKERRTFKNSKMDLKTLISYRESYLYGDKLAHNSNEEDDPTFCIEPFNTDNSSQENFATNCLSCFK